MMGLDDVEDVEDELSIGNMELDHLQTSVLIDNYGLIGYFISLKEVRGKMAEYSEWHGLIAESLVKAIRAFDSSRGALSTLFFTIANRDFYSANLGSGNKSKVWFLGSSTTIDDEDWLQDLSIYEPFDSRLIEDDCDRDSLDYLLAGYNQREISELTGVSQPTVSRTLSRVRKEVKFLIQESELL